MFAQSKSKLYLLKIPRTTETTICRFYKICQHFNFDVVAVLSYNIEPKFSIYSENEKLDTIWAVLAAAGPYDSFVSQKNKLERRHAYEIK